MSKGMWMLSGLIIGAGAGLAAGLLYAPRPGVETRAMVADKVDEYWGTGREYYARGMEKVADVKDATVVKAGEIKDATVVKAGEIRDFASTRVEEAKPRIAETGEELRERISAARERISTEVGKNAEAAKAKMGELFPGKEPTVDATVINA